MRALISPNLICLYFLNNDALWPGNTHQADNYNTAPADQTGDVRPELGRHIRVRVLCPGVYQYNILSEKIWNTIRDWDCGSPNDSSVQYWFQCFSDWSRLCNVICWEKILWFLPALLWAPTAHREGVCEILVRAWPGELEGCDCSEENNINHRNR